MDSTEAVSVPENPGLKLSGNLNPGSMTHWLHESYSLALSLSLPLCHMELKRVTAKLVQRMNEVMHTYTCWEVIVIANDKNGRGYQATAVCW